MGLLTIERFPDRHLEIRAGSARAPRQYASLLPFDQADDYGDVHTTLPPEQVIPASIADDPLFLIADFTGVTIDLDRWTPAAPRPLPLLVGANSTPLAMLMTPMLPLYSRYWQDADLTEHAERGHRQIVASLDVWNENENGRSLSDDEMVAWGRYCKAAFGLGVIWWQGGRPPDQPRDRLKRLLDADVVDWYIHGKEVDLQMRSEDFEASLQAVDRYIGGRVPIGVHFSADPFDPARGGRGMGYPIGFPRDTFLGDWRPYDGRVHLMMQMCVDAPAGLMGANMYYARAHINCGQGDGVPDGAKGKGAPRSRVVAFENKSTAQLYGRCTETDGCRAAWQLLCGTRHDPRALPVSGSCGGLRLPSGWPPGVE